MDLCFQILLQCNLLYILAVFWCIHKNIFCFVGIDLVLSTKSCSTCYNGQITAVCIFYQAPNRRERMGSDDRSEQDLNAVVNPPASGKL